MTGNVFAHPKAIERILKGDTGSRGATLMRAIALTQLRRDDDKFSYEHWRCDDGLASGAHSNDRPR